MSENVDWSKYVSEQEKLVTNKLATVNIDQNAQPSTGASGHKPKLGNDEEQFSPAEVSLLQKIIRNGLVENKNDLEVQRRDPTSPLYSVKNFEALNLYVVKLI